MEGEIERARMHTCKRRVEESEEKESRVAVLDECISGTCCEMQYFFFCRFLFNIYDFAHKLHGFSAFSLSENNTKHTMLSNEMREALGASQYVSELLSLWHPFI